MYLKTLIDSNENEKYQFLSNVWKWDRLGPHFILWSGFNDISIIVEMVFIPQGLIQNSLLKLQGTVIRITQPPLKHGARSALLNSCLSQNMTNSKIRRSKHPLLSMVESSWLLYHISTDSRYRFETVNLYYIDIL